MLERAIQAVKDGRRKEAHALLSQLVQQEPDNERAWLWLAESSASDDEKLACLREVWRINPQNQEAIWGIRALTGKLGLPQPDLESGPAVPKLPSVEPPAPSPQARETSAMDRKTQPAMQAVRSGVWSGMMVFALRKLAFGLLVLVCIAFLSYFGLNMARGAPFTYALTQAAWQTTQHLGRLLQGDWGMSGAASTTLRAIPVIDILPQVLLRSLGLLAISMLIALVVGVGLGIWAARRRHSGWSLIMLLTSITGVSVPSFFAALLLQLVVIRLTRMTGRVWLPVGGFGWDEHLLLPALVLAARPLAQVARITFVSVGNVLDQDYVRTAHSKGLARQVVMGRHVIRNAAIPILTTVGLSLRFALSSLPVIEFFFGWSGMGFSLLKAISQQDNNLTIALVLCLGVLFILVNLALEVAYQFIDPRLRQQTRQALRAERQGLWSVLRSLFVGVWDLLIDNALVRRLFHRRPPAPSPFRALAEARGITAEVDSQMHQEERRRAWTRGTLTNLPFMLGAVLVVALVGVVLFGPLLAPHSPYTTRGLEYKDGQLSVPPFAPDDVYPLGADVLGRDVLSLILSGAQQTLLLTVIIVAARMFLGIFLGALAGWLSGSWLDRLLLSTGEIIAAFPTLLLAMTLILALGIRQGMFPFIIALCFVGWSEIMQFVRGEVMAIQPKLFIEGAVAVGLRTPRIILSHVLPNLLPALISLAALEMGSVLMLLGELGFVGIFIGGGAFAELDVAGAPYHYSDVPEWGALLSNVRLYARSYPWTAIYPTLAFFLAIWGFNLFGEGIRRMVETVGIGINRVLNRYTLAVGLLALIGVGWARGNTGATAFYRQQAAKFEPEAAMAHIDALADPAWQGRALGTPGLDAAADYIAQQFQAIGLQSAGEEMTYFQTGSRSFEQLDAVPHLAVTGVETDLVYHRDYAEFPGYYRSWGSYQGQVRFIGARDLSRIQAMTFAFYKGLEDLDVRGDILLVPSYREVFFLRNLVHSGMLVIADEPADLQRRYTLSSQDPNWRMWGTGREIGGDIPLLGISTEVADQLLRDTGYTVADLRRQTDALPTGQILNVGTGQVVSMTMQGTVVEKVPVRNVIGHLPGLSDSRYGGLNNEVIVVLAQYDSPPLGPQDLFYPAANDNASGVAVMLEAARTMQESGYRPYRTFLFVAYCGEGLDGGMSIDPSDVSKFLQAKYGFSGLQVEAIVHLRGLGAGEGDHLLLSAGGSMRLTRLLERAARWADVSTRRAHQPVDISIVFESRGVSQGGQEAPEIALNWEGWANTSRLPADGVDAISVSHLDQAGRTLALALMIMGRELDY